MRSVRVIFLCCLLTAALAAFCCGKSKGEATGTDSEGADQPAEGEEGRKIPLLDYLDNVEVQYENEDQRENLISALSDAISTQPEDLEKIRYSDYQGNPEQWDLQMMFTRYLVPDSKDKRLGDDFYNDVTRPEVQDKIAVILAKIKPEKKKDGDMEK